MHEDDRDRDFWDRKAPQYERVAKGVFGRPVPRVLKLTAAGVSEAETVLVASRRSRDARAFEIPPPS